MKKLHSILFAAAAIVCMTAVQGCSCDEPEPKHQVSVNDNEINFGVTQGQKKFTITSKINWIITATGLNGTDGGWYTISAANGSGNAEITIDAHLNPTGVERTAILTVKGKYNRVTVTIKQAADGDGMLDVAPSLLTDFKTINAPTQTFAITSPFEWTIVFKDKTTYNDPLNPAIDPQWATVDATGGEGDKTITVTAKDNGTGAARTGEFTITAAGKIKTVTVNQLTDLNNSFNPEFLAWCLDPAKGAIDADRDGSISVTEAEETTKIDCNIQSFTSLKGIENFTKLIYLRCYSNRLESLDLSANTELSWLSCYDNKLTALDLSANTKLTSLSCGDNQLSELNLSVNRELTTLFCRNNPNLATIDIRGSSFEKLTGLHCTSIKLGVKFFVWSGFNIADKPAASTWEYDLGAIWEPVS